MTADEARAPARVAASACPRRIPVGPSFSAQARIELAVEQGDTMGRSLRKMLISLAVCGAVAAAPSAALAWAAGTHAYIAKHTNKMGGLVTDAEMCRRILGA